MGFKVVESPSSNLALATRLLLLPSARKRPMATWLVDPGDAFCLLGVEAAALPDKQPTLAMASAKAKDAVFWSADLLMIQVPPPVICHSWAISFNHGTAAPRVR